jgi:hypothetical protein
MILRERCAEQGIATRIDVTQASPEFLPRVLSAELGSTGSIDVGGAAAPRH